MFILFLYGEIFRELTFDQDRKNDKLGCYSCFKLRKGFEEIKPKFLKFREEYDVNKAMAFSNGGLIVEWFWGGDGTLYFEMKNGIKVINTDCKKTDNWEFVE